MAIAIIAAGRRIKEDGFSSFSKTAPEIFFIGPK